MWTDGGSDHTFRYAKLGIKNTAEAEIEEEMFTMPTIDNMVVLAVVLGVTIDEILVVDDNVRVQISA